MWPLMIVEFHLARQSLPRSARRSVIVKIDFLILDGALQAFRKDIVQGAAPSIHADLHGGFLQPLDVLRAGEMANLIRVPDARLGVLQCAVHRRQDELDFQVVTQFPTHDIKAKRVYRDKL